MMPGRPGGTREGWTRQRVEHRLVAAFRLMPACPVFGLPTRLRTAGDERTPLTEVLEWPGLIADDPTARKILLAWARCRAQRTSFGAFCEDMGWARATAEVARRRGAARIAALLDARPE